MAKTFDPNKPYEIVEDAPKRSLKTFDPNKPYKIVEDANIPSETESLIRGLAQNASLGFADEAAGAGDALYKKIQGDQTPLADLYHQGRDESRELYKLAQQENPKSYLGGQVAGAVIPGLLTGGSSIAGLTAQGALQGLGSSEADLTQGDVKGAARDTAIGGAIGAGTGLIGSALSQIPVGKMIGSLGDKIKGGAEDLAKLATGVDDLGENAGRELLDQGVVKFGDTTGNIAQRASALPSPQMGAVTQLKDEVVKNPGLLKEGGAFSSLTPADAASFVAGGPKAFIAKKVLAPRAVSSGAVIADNLGDVLKATPHVFGKFAAPLQAAAQRGETSLAATNFVLQQTNPEYRALVFNNKTDADE